jgi:hypothetical protein
MLSWHVPYLGWTRLPADVSEFEITHFFSLRAEERSAVLTRYRDSLRLGAALQIGVTVPKTEKYTVEDPVFSTAYARLSR